MEENTENKELRELWNVELDILNKVKEICVRHNLKWFAFGGTLLGTIRHDGFIPWDDDIDIAMLAEDYDKFCQIARFELDDPYCIQYFAHGNRLAPWHIKIRRSDTTGCTQWEKDNMPESYNKGIFIDVFPLYSIPDNEDEAELVIKKLKKMKYTILVNQVTHSNRYLEKPTFRKIIKKIYYDVKITFLGGYDRACVRFLRLCRSGSDNSVKVGLLSFLPGDQRWMWKRSVFDRLVNHRFENTTIPIPEKYDEFLKTTYGNYMTPQKGTEIHSDLTYSTEVSYVDYFSCDS